MKALTEKAGLFKFIPAIGDPIVDALSESEDAIGISFSFVPASAGTYTARILRFNSLGIFHTS